MTVPAWTEVPAHDLDVPTLYDVLALRAEVFVVEQACAYLDVDGQDLLPGTWHLLGRVGAEIAAYARILGPDDAHPTPRIGRVIVRSTHRGRRLARDLMERAIALTRREFPGPVELGAQAHLERFYAGLGFEPVGEPYDEDGILHVWMRREPAAG